MENSTDRIKRLQAEMDRERRAIADCDHVFGEAKYDPEEVDDQITELVGHGSDVWPEVVGHRTKTVDRWSKTCEKCGHKLYTKQRKPVAFEPDFGRAP